jgi:Icc-related predicted phosphoesterase
MGNDDPRFLEAALITGGRGELWVYLNERRYTWNGYVLYGYNYVPPTPFMLKDWERYDVSRYVDPGCVSPEDGRRSFPASEHEMKWTTIKDDLEKMTEENSLEKAIFLFHSPPYGTSLDKGDLKGQMIDHVPLDEHLGSIAIKRFIEERQPLLTLHGHIHESTAVTDRWSESIGRTVCINGAGEGGVLTLVRIDLKAPSEAKRLEIF